MHIELEPSCSWKVDFHGLLLELQGVKVFCTQIGSWKVDDMNLDWQISPGLIE